MLETVAHNVNWARKSMGERGDVYCPIRYCTGNHIPDLPLLRKVIGYIKENPKEWNQGSWITDQLMPHRYYEKNNRIIRVKAEEKNLCGTSYCVAGHAMVMSGEVETVGFDVMRPSVEWMFGATHLLGLTTDERGDLFNGDNSFGDILKVSKKIAASVGEEL